MPSTNRTRDAELMDADRVEDLKDPDSWANDNLIYDDPQHKDFALSRYRILSQSFGEIIRGDDLYQALFASSAFIQPDKLLSLVLLSLPLNFDVNHHQK